ncbi:hypothetical protein U91I_01192 [alpha proteobacterium U9-1i]|nr:hypothetical protein U91I_01192 [alpha proteobacterium U9-1i]
MNKSQIIAAMEAIVTRAENENRDMTDAEIAEFDKLKAQLATADANESRRAGLAALRQASGVSERLDRFALNSTDRLAALAQFARPNGNTTRAGDLIRANLGMGAYDIGASQSRGSGPGGGFTVPSFLSAEIIDAARAKSRVITAGARTIPVSGDTSFATIDDDPTFANHAENATIDESEIVFGSRNFAPQTKVCLIRASVELVEDSPTFNDTVDAVLAAAFAVEMDRLALNGSGIGEQLGVLATDGVHEISGAGLNTWAPFARAYQAVRSSNHTPGAFILSPGAMGAIDNLVEGGGSNNPLRRPPSLEATQFLDTTSIEDEGSPIGTQAVTGEWQLLFLAIRSGLTIEASRVGGDAFNKLSVLIRAYARLDSFVVRKAAFAKVTGIPVPAIG